MIPEGLEGTVGELARGYEGGARSLGSGRYVGLGGWPFGYAWAWEWPSIWHRGPGNWPVIRDRPLKARAGLKTLSLLSRGRPLLVQAGVGALGLGLRYSGRVGRGDWGYSVGVQVLGKELPNGTKRFEGTDHEKAVGSQRWFCLARRKVPGGRTM